ncbi:BTAD domain-containing putative transcriptional regulator [Gordonia sp. ABSL1-1]|uniref:BTAD domain-containing putative transcriptional regulator n=1 Tax=Gordonia sp. ABSL1-1 TaxID=3053923 RepID=UPI0025746B4C|nr:BTAD domain-containing putative transcriptional regulator [Gordonia sp. ABSL1-1]MDL9935774.1 BTAD domain-containing putative transcriptional regulator [Gordonia sp. ABSL1-1]
MREYLILGVMEVRCDGVPVDLGSPKQRAVLAALVLARGAVVSTDRLIDAVWGTAPPPAALTSLQAYVSNLRRALRGGGADPSSIERVNPGYRLDVTGDRVDLADFTQRAYAARQASAAGDWPAALAESEAALSLWRGPLLAEFGDEDWVAVEAAALAESLNAVRDAHIGALLAHDDTAGALAEIQVLRADEPLRDRGVWLQMVSLHRAGRTTEALDTYATHVRALADELGLDPGVELRELHAAILRHDPAIAGWPQPPSGARAVAAPAQPTARVAEHPADTALDPRPLVGRVDECAALAACFRGTMPTASRWVVLQGPAGIGKSRLAEEAARYATDAGERAIWVRCPDVEGIPAWWPMRQLCRALDVSATELLSMPGGADADTARFVIYERLQHLVEQAAALGPLTVIVDDAQWADSMSLGFLTYLTGVVRDVPICLIVTVRDDEGNADVDRLRVAMNRADGLIIDVPRLATDEVAALVRQIADDDITDVAARALADRTGGNPLFVSEYARLPNDQRLGQVTPAVVRSVLDRRLAALDPGVLEVVAHAAVLGEVVDPPVLAEVMGRDVESIMDCLDEAADEHILIASPMRGGTGFAHALLREQAVSTIRPLRRARIHARAADVLGGPGLPDAVARRAAHLLAAVGVVEPQVIVHACRAAADEATAQWDSPNAAYWLESALATYESLPATEFVLSERDSLLLDLLEALSRAGRAQSVLEMVEDRLEQAVRHGSTATIGRLASALVRSGGGWPWMAPWGGPGRLHTVLATAEVAAADDPSSRARVLAALAIGHCYHHDASVPAGLLDEAELLSVTVGDPDVTADVLLARMITYSGVADHVDEAFAVAERLATLDHQQAPVDRVIADSVLTMALMMAGNIVATEVHLRRGIVGSERLKLPILRAQLRWMELTLAVWRGEFDLASEHYRVAVAVHEETELYVAGSGAIAMMALAAEQGLLDQVVDTADVDPVSWARSMTAQFQDNDVALLLCSGIAVIAGRAGDRELATTMVEVWLADERPMVWTSLAQAVLLAHVVADLGMTVYAQRFVDYLMPFRHMVATVGQVGCVGPVGLALAELLIMLGRAEEAEPILDDVAVLAARTGGVPAALRVRLLQVLAQPPGPGRDRALGDIERTAAGIGLVQVAARAAARPVEETG